ncbi:Uncharacterised protein [uncultured archaeon]|nr:Uncharacterised protein [uncultured archaeon]
MGNKTVMIFALLSVMITVTVIASAGTPPEGYTCKPGNVNGMEYGECIKSTFDGTYFQTSVLNLAEDKYYVLRYYPPGTLPCDPTDSIECQNILNSGTVPPGYIPGSSHLTPPTFYDEQSPFKPTVAGWWIITLWHSGTGTGGNEELIKSFKLWTPVDVSITEFPTVALPIAGVIGLVFFFQYKKKKEE